MEKEREKERENMLEGYDPIPTSAKAALMISLLKWWILTD